MEQMYEIPLVGAERLSVGHWVEIFEAYGRAEGGMPIRVRSMRVGGEILIFGRVDGRHPGTKSLHPHEGEVVYIDRERGKTRFAIRLGPEAS